MLKKVIFSVLFVLCLLLFSAFSLAVELSAKGAVLIEDESGDIVLSKNKDMRMPMASTTKIMTSIIVLENCDLNTVVKIEPHMTGIEGSSIYLHEGEELTVLELLYALMLESANDAAVALAYTVCDSIEEFAQLMNEKADSLGLCNTHFTNPHGLDDDEHYTTPYELGLIASYAMKNPTFKKIVSTYKHVIPLNNGEGSRVLINHNKLIRSYDGAIGIKTGYTKRCGRCLVSCANIDGVQLICVTLNAPNDWSDHTNMLNYGFSKYERVNLANSRDYTVSLNVINGSKSSFYATNFSPFSATVKKGNTNITAVLEADRLISAPINSGDVVGKIVFYDNNKKIGEINLYALENVSEIKYNKPLLERFFRKWKK